MKNNFICVMFFFATIGFFFTGCNDSSTDDDSQLTVEISGIVATGAPLDNAVITAVNINGDSAGPVNVNEAGKYSLTVNEGPPYLLKAYSKEEGITLFSYSAGNTAANITPLTSLAIFVATGVDISLSDLYDTWINNPLSESEVMMAARMVNANLADFYDVNSVHAKTYNFFETPFATDGNGIDGVLDDLKIDIVPEAPTIDSLINIVDPEENNIIFDLYADISEYFLIDRITPAAAFEKISRNDALLVCTYSDESCKSILMENTMLKSELELQMNTLPKSQEIIFY